MNVWVPVAALCVNVVSNSLSLSLYYSQVALPSLHDVKGERNDSISLEWDRPRNSPLFPLLSLFFIVCLLLILCPHYLTSPSGAFISSLCASLGLSSDPNAVGQHGTDHALIGGVVAVVVFVTLCLIIVLGRYLARHKGKTTVEQT